jgi:FkbM family methyltransferase
VDGLRIYHDGKPFCVQPLAMGDYEPGITHLFKTRIQPGMTVLDVGANIGYFSLLAAQLAGATGAVWAFEPTPHLVKLLERSIRENGFESRIHVVPAAVSSTLGTSSFHVNVQAHVMSSLYAEASRTPLGIEGQYEYERIDVPCTSLDAWAAAHDWPPVDFVKMDIEGAEKEALDGMRALSHRNPRLQLIIEFSVRNLHAAGVTVEEFYTALRDCGFRRVSWIVGDRRLLNVPMEVPWRLLVARLRSNAEYVNLLCEKSGT